MTTNVPRIYEPELRRLLRVDADGMTSLRTEWQLPSPVDSDGNGAYWSVPAVRDWIHTTGHLTTGEVALGWWPDATGPVGYLGADVLRSTQLAKPWAVLQSWSTDHGTIVVVWSLGQDTATEPQIRPHAPGAAVYLRVGPGVDETGPELRTRDPLTGRDTDVAWTDLARVLGQPAPFWPYALRIPELITAWAPGDAAVRHHGAPKPDVTPLLQMAMLHRPEDPIHRAMIHTAQLIQTTVLRVSDLSDLQKTLEQGSLGHGHVAIAALPAPQLEKAPELDQTTLRSGWRELQRRDDWLAEQCMEILGSWNGGKNLTHAHGVQVGLDSPTTREFVARLEPAPRTAQYMLFDWNKIGETFVDPLTDAPVTIDQAGQTVTVLAPDRLPTTSPLASIILDGDVWIRTQDGTLYPAPLDSRYGLSWGYHGSGPAALAILAQQLLDDITSPGARLPDGPACDGLRDLFETKWPHGTIFTRAQLEEARDA